MPHEPTNACVEVHCLIHHEDEPIPAGSKPYRVCGECFHVYWTARDLRRSYRRIERRIREKWTWRWRGTPGWDEGVLPRRLWRRIYVWFFLSASKIYSCPECSHDW